MTLHPEQAWHAVTASPLFGVVLTLAVYALAREVWSRTGQHAAMNPVLLSIVAIGSVLSLSHVSYSTYMHGGDLVALFLGPATVALAYPLYREFHLIKQALLPTLLGVSAGCCASITVAYWLTRALGGSRQLAVSMAPKSATTPVSIALSASNGGVAALTAVFTIISGILGAIAGPALLTVLRFRDDRVRGLAIGTASHGIGTARLLATRSRTAAAFSGLAMALNTLATSIALPILLSAR